MMPNDAQPTYLDDDASCYLTCKQTDSHKCLPFLEETASASDSSGAVTEGR
jgi:hypothetical protein